MELWRAGLETWCCHLLALRPEEDTYLYEMGIIIPLSSWRIFLKRLYGCGSHMSPSRYLVMSARILIVITDGGCYWPLVGRGQGCYWTSYRVPSPSSPPKKTPENYQALHINSFKVDKPCCVVTSQRTQGPVKATIMICRNVTLEQQLEVVLIKASSPPLSYIKRRTLERDSLCYHPILFPGIL